MKFTKRNIAYITGAVVLTTVIAACKHGSPEERGAKLVDKVANKLELTDAQTSDLTVVKNELLEFRTTVKSQKEKTKADIVAMLEQPVLDRVQAAAIVNGYVETINDQSPEIIAALGNFYDGLDESQRAELREFVNKHHERHKHHSF